MPLVFAFTYTFEDGEPGIFGVGNGEGLEFGGGIELGDDLADRTFAEGTLGDWGGIDGAAQREGSRADFAFTLAIADFVFVEGHEDLDASVGPGLESRIVVVAAFGQFHVFLCETAGKSMLGRQRGRMRVRGETIMQRIIAGMWLWVALAVQCQGATEPLAEPPVEPPVYRYLILIEAGASMARQKDVALDTVHQLILNRMNGRIQRGDVLGIWPFKSQVDRKLTRPIHWSPVEARDLANFIYRKLRDLEFSKESRIEPALTAAAAEASRGKERTVLLIASGTEPVQGTPFDREINAVFEQHREGMIKAKRPFVCALIYERGELVAQAVTPGGMAIFIPPSPTARAAIAREALPEPIEPEAEGTVTSSADPKPVPMGVNEIEAKLREAQAARLAREAAEATAESEVEEAAVETEVREAAVVAIPTMVLPDREIGRASGRERV